MPRIDAATLLQTKGFQLVEYGEQLQDSGSPTINTLLMAFHSYTIASLPL